ncbi:nitroreductase [Endozoicomonas sp. SCSIO W0465]|uniref:nitroreductase family protein n=1 Tax=Endozoicomonas sp. SCSIO W0465 TaxID=2918516 RepID=UPI0020760C1E|nr:nitroreductase [Endozoicomonas sp. SCSIO W0465]USE35655.1 nitroreductase [Endozoicomonas sp. SCSIO W0465]
MDGIELLLERVSSPMLEAPAPTDQQLDVMFQAALRAPDHARLRPWRFLAVRDEAREALGELMAKVALEDQPDLSEDALARFRGMPLRAPMLVLAICPVKQHPKVPEIEQKMSLAAAVQSLLLAAYAQGVGAIWRTGALCYHPLMAKGLGLADNEQLMGFIYLGKPTGTKKKVPVLEVNQFVAEWK